MMELCEKCGSDKLKKSKKGLGIVCGNCYHYKHYNDEATVDKLLNHVPTTKEKLLHLINENKESIFEYGYVGEYISVETLLEGINKIF